MLILIDLISTPIPTPNLDFIGLIDSQADLESLERLADGKYFWPSDKDGALHVPPVSTEIYPVLWSIMKNSGGIFADLLETASNFCM